MKTLEQRTEEAIAKFIAPDYVPGKEVKSLKNALPVAQKGPIDENGKPAMRLVTQGSGFGFSVNGSAPRTFRVIVQKGRGYSIHSL